ncbi:hypothetical protein JVU11DRAFT_3244 [Chiua virens]|nr:hypothetical protein JVU11DRAFT_3244 [Chiua virens]
MVCIAARNSLERSLGHETRPDTNHDHDGINHLPDDEEPLYNDDSDENRSRYSPQADSEGRGNSPTMTSEDGFDDHDLFDFEDGWEAPAMHPYSDPLDLEMDVEMTDPLEQEVSFNGDESTNCQTHAALQQTQGKCTLVDHYPGNAAGRPISTQAPHTPNANWRYTEQLESCQVDALSENPYWPFTSQLDWEVAR